MFIPIYDTNRAVSAPLTTWMLILGASVIFYQLIGEEPTVRMEYFRSYGFYPANYTSWEQFQNHIRQYFSSLFIHLDGRHWLASVWAFWTFGRPLERQLGRWLYFGFIITVVCLSFGLEYWRYFGLGLMPENQPLVGLSMLSASVGAAFCIILPHYRLLSFNPLFLIMPMLQPMPAWYYFILWLGFQIIGSQAGYWPTLAGNYSQLTLLLTSVFGMIVGGSYFLWLKYRPAKESES